MSCMPDRGSLNDDSLQSWKFGWNFAAVTAVTMLAYAWFTIKTTAWREVTLVPLHFVSDVCFS